MANPRTPTAKAKVSGAAIKNPQRHKTRADPKVVDLGKASSFLKGGALAAWDGFKRELPWLTEADRGLVEIASMIRGRFMDGEDVGVSAINQLRMCLAQMGATPADRSKITVPDGDDSDPADKFFGRPN